MPPALGLSTYFGAYFLYVGAFVPYFALYLAARGFGAAEIATPVGPGDQIDIVPALEGG